MVSPSNNAIAPIDAYERALKLREQPFLMPLLEDLSDWRGKRALVFAPHEDDEVLGCGGTIKRLIDIGAKVRTVYITDGSQGSIEKRRGLANIRKLEAVAGLEVLGCQDYVFLGFKDGKLEMSKEGVEAVRGELSSFRPHGLFVTHPFDGPSDHVIASAIVGQALRSYRSDIECFNYEIWNPVLPNRLVDITGEIGAKEEAMRKHVSQMEIVDYMHHFKGLNAYRAIYTPGCDYCEAFLKLGREEHILLCNEALKDPHIVKGGYTKHLRKTGQGQQKVGPL
jgi:N-acetylglucosamine malate deacetylase 1